MKCGKNANVFELFGEKMRCKWCYAENSHYDTDKQMSTGLAKELVNISLDFGVKEFVLIGGEPTLWNGFFEIIKYIKENGAKISIITNGMRFSEDKFWENYKKDPATSIGLSVKAATKEIFNVATGIDQYEKSMVGIQRIIQFHQCGVSAVHNKLVGIDGIVDIAKKCREFGATSFFYIIKAWQHMKLFMMRYRMHIIGIVQLIFFIRLIN